LSAGAERAGSHRGGRPHRGTIDPPRNKNVRLLLLLRPPPRMRLLWNFVPRIWTRMPTRRATNRMRMERKRTRKEPSAAGTFGGSNIRQQQNLAAATFSSAKLATTFGNKIGRSSRNNQPHSAATFSVEIGRQQQSATAVGSTDLPRAAQREILWGGGPRGWVLSKARLSPAARQRCGRAGQRRDGNGHRHGDDGGWRDGGCGCGRRSGGSCRGKVIVSRGQNETVHQVQVPGFRRVGIQRGGDGNAIGGVAAGAAVDLVGVATGQGIVADTGRAGKGELEHQRQLRVRRNDVAQDARLECLNKGHIFVGQNLVSTFVLDAFRSIQHPPVSTKPPIVSKLLWSWSGLVKMTHTFDSSGKASWGQSTCRWQGGGHCGGGFLSNLIDVGGAATDSAIRRLLRGGCRRCRHYHPRIRGLLPRNNNGNTSCVNQTPTNHDQRQGLTLLLSLVI
jgi:hypothetical protein